MERKGPRGAKPKNVPPGNLITLGTKSGRSDAQIDKTAGHGSSFVTGKTAGAPGERGRDGGCGSSALLAKKNKPGFGAASAAGRTGVAKQGSGDMVNLLSEEWENVATEVDPNDLIPFIEAVEDYEGAEMYLCGAVKTLRSHRTKPDNLLCFSLMYLAKVKPHLFSKSDMVVEAFCSLLKRDHSMTYKSKGNAAVSVLAANILLAAFQDERAWPDIFVRVYIEDSLGERLWVDHEDCRGFVDNIATAFKTKLPPKSLLYPDVGMGSRQDCPSPPVSGGSGGGGDSGDGDSELSLECKESLDVSVVNRYAALASEVEEMVMEAVQHQLGVRHQSPDTVTRNFIRFLSSVCGIVEVRRQVAPRLEQWLQSAKLQRPATELLMSLCLNCSTHSQLDVECISHIIRIRLKHKPLINQYMSCLKELLAAHADNIPSVMKHTLYNELSQARNPSNMSILSVIFQFAPEHAAIILAEEFQELLCNREDYLRALRALLREIVRALRHDMQFQKFCQGLMKDRKDATFRESFEFKERMFHSITDLIVLTMFVAISPQVRESGGQLYRGEPRELESVRRYQELVACIQRDALHWLYKVVPKCYSPSKEEFTRCLHKLLMFEQAEVYYVKDNWPTENDRPLYFRLTSEIPVKQETLTRLLMMAVMKDQWIKPQDLIELVDKIIKRAAALHSDDIEVLHVDDTKVVELIFNLCPYIPPENSPLPQGYRPPKTAIANLYWKSWIMLLLITAHNPTVFGLLAWESYPTLRTLMEMCITNSFVFPPPTLASGEKGDEMTAQELHLWALERQQILDFESHLAQKTITEQNSLLLSQLITLDPNGPARKPPPIVLDQLKALNTSHKVGHLLCRSRNPDFLVDIIQRQGASQSMPWLAELVQSSEGAFSVLPVQCLCEFLLSEAGGGVGAGEGAARHHQLLQHLRSLLRAPRQEDGVSVEILEYFLRRLSSQQAAARTQAVRGLQLVVAPLGDPMDTGEGDAHTPHAWLLQHLPNLPGFDLVQGVASQALRAACQIETDPHAVSAYIRFLAVHTKNDPLQDQAELVQDMAQLIVERCTMISAILPAPDRPSQPFPHCHSTLKALLIIFINYMRGVRLPPRESFSWSESQDQVRVQWATGEQAVMHILVVHAMVILLTHGPDNSHDLFHELLTTWFPEQEEMPQAFLVDTSEEALLLPDWLKLKMIRSTVPQLVDAALKDLEPSQLVLFIQSFGIPVGSMTKLLCALDMAVNTNDEAVAAAVLDKSHKTYMAQLVEVQHQRGAQGGHAFAATLGERDDLDATGGEQLPHISPLVTPLKVQDTMRVLQRHFSKEISRCDPEAPYIKEFLSSLSAIVHSVVHAPSFLAGLHDHYIHSAALFRLLKNLHNKRGCENLYGLACQLVSIILHKTSDRVSPLTKVLRSFNVEEVPCKEIKKEAETEIDTSSTETVLKHLTATKPCDLEKEIRRTVERAMWSRDITSVTGALSQLLLSGVSMKQEMGTTVSTGTPTALLLDWLQVLDPELNGSDCLQQALLFRKRGTEERKEGGYSQACLLAAFIHQARWDTLEHCVRTLLHDFNPNLDPASVLNFVWAVLHVPKLWQGRERRTPRHVPQESQLSFSSSEVVHLSRYMVSECEVAFAANRGPESLDIHLPLLLHILTDNPALLQALAEHLEQASQGTAGHLLYHLYLRMPRIISHLPAGTISRVVAAGASGGQAQESRADVVIHKLLTMLAAPRPDQDFRRRMCDLEAAVRKQAASHPLLVLRHLPLLAASLKGTHHLNLNVLRNSNHLELFSMVLGVLELLQPHLFAPQHLSALTATLDSFMALFKTHSRTHELDHLLVRFSHLMMEWVGYQGGPAGTYLCTHSSLLATLQAHHTDIPAVRSLAAIAAARGMDRPKESSQTQQCGSDPVLSSGVPQGPLAPPWVMAQVGELQARLETTGLPEARLDILKKVIDLPDRWVNAALPSFTHTFCEGMVSNNREVRLVCWDLVARLLHQRPALGGLVGQAVMASLKHEDSAVVEAALEHLPEVILLLQDQSVDLLTAAFVATLSASSCSTAYLSEALTLLHLHTGA
ncbi:Integrator complex subunit 1 [Portunus trituberculatus]|uniref:Integrator complex subunit 1 n=1 Tax=Portunus trituberculatus TaxID=210409 RepID=A0A5B7EU69_PORTR|nr:Integrator complex subunit 1 [Portunus trituberculatus]